MQLQRDVAHGAHVDADVFASSAVAARGAAYQHAVLIKQTDRQAIKFRLAAVLHRRPATEQIAGRQVQTFGHPAIKFAHIGFFEGVAEAEHRHFVTHLGERGQRHAADALGRRVAGDQFRVGRFQRFELVEQPVVLGVRNARLVEDVVTVVVLIEFSAQFKNAVFGGGHGCSLKKQKSSRSCSNSSISGSRSKRSQPSAAPTDIAIL
ncbi:hypothetical protein D3C87_1105300 [compost metagenome]